MIKKIEKNFANSNENNTFNLFYMKQIETIKIIFILYYDKIYLVHCLIIPIHYNIEECRVHAIVDNAVSKRSLW
jgi:hypothetical protein